MTNFQILAKKTIYYFLFLSQLHRLLRFINRNKTAILMYHGFANHHLNRRDHSFLKFGEGKHLSIKKFRKQLDYLKKHYRIISLEDFVKSAHEGKKLPPYSLVLTMDDGYLSNYKLAYPLLKKTNLPATIFVATEFVQQQNFLWTDRIEYAFRMARYGLYQLQIDSLKKKILIKIDNKTKKLIWCRKIKKIIKNLPEENRGKIVEKNETILNNKLILNPETPEFYLPLNWEQIKEMKSSQLISIGSHTHTHPILSRCSPAAVRKEISLSKGLIEQQTGARCNLFCYPNGSRQDFNDYTQAVLKQNDFSCALSTIEGFNDQSSDLFALKRIWVSQEMNQMEFVLDVAGMKLLMKKLLHI